MRAIGLVILTLMTFLIAYNAGVNAGFDHAINYDGRCKK